MTVSRPPNVEIGTPATSHGIVTQTEVKNVGPVCTEDIIRLVGAGNGDEAENTRIIKLELDRRPCQNRRIRECYCLNADELTQELVNDTN